jgi:hypothetical protein
MRAFDRAHREERRFAHVARSASSRCVKPPQPNALPTHLKARRDYRLTTRSSPKLMLRCNKKTTLPLLRQLVM